MSATLASGRSRGVAGAELVVGAAVVCRRVAVGVAGLDVGLAVRLVGAASDVGAAVVARVVDGAGVVDAGGADRAPDPLALGVPDVGLAGGALRDAAGVEGAPAEGVPPDVEAVPEAVVLGAAVPRTAFVHAARTPATPAQPSAAMTRRREMSSAVMPQPYDCVAPSAR